MAQICKKCLLREMAEADAKMIEKYKEAIKKEDQVSESEYERRLTVCKTCELLNAGTCGACGCYVELRAAAAVSKCPYKKWRQFRRTVTIFYCGNITTFPPPGRTRDSL